MFGALGAMGRAADSTNAADLLRGAVIADDRTQYPANGGADGATLGGLAGGVYLGSVLFTFHEILLVLLTVDALHIHNGIVGASCREQQRQKR